MNGLIVELFRWLKWQSLSRCVEKWMPYTFKIVRPLVTYQEET